MESACVVCLEISPGMYTLESKGNKKMNLASLLTRFGGLTITTGKICHADRQSLLQLTRIADKFYNKCQESLLKRLLSSEQLSQDESIKHEDSRVCSDSNGVDRQSEATDNYKKAATNNNSNSEDNVTVKTEANESMSIELDVINEVTDVTKSIQEQGSDDTDIDYWESQDSDAEIPQKKRLVRSTIKSRVVGKRGRPRKNGSEWSDVKVVKKNKSLNNLIKTRNHTAERRGVTRYSVADMLKEERRRKRKEESSDEDSENNESVLKIVEVKEEEETDVDEKPQMGGKKMRKRKKDDRHKNFESGICYLCGTVFQSRSGFMAHMKSHKPVAEARHQCDLCDKSYTRPSYLRLHIRKEHYDVKPPVNIKGVTDRIPAELPCFICHQCGKCLTSRGKLKYHMEGHSAGGATKPHACSLCDKKFRQANALKIHMRRHTGELPFHCSLCEGRFTDAYSLRRHQQYNHSPGSSVPCSECNRHFASLEELAEHMPIHNRAKAYQCPSCGRGFRNRSNLSKHKKIHTGIKACVCTQCPAKFRTMTHLKRHVNMVHNEVKPYQCPVCNGRFTSSQSLKRHGWLHTQAWKEKRELILVPPVTDISWIAQNKTENSSASNNELTVVSAASEIMDDAASIMTSRMTSQGISSSIMMSSFDATPVLSSMINVPMMLASSAQSPISLTMTNRNAVSDCGVRSSLEPSYTPAMRTMLGLSQAAAVMSAIESSSSMPLSSSLSTLSSSLPLLHSSMPHGTEASRGSLVIVPMGSGETKLLPGMRLDNMSTPVSPGAVALITRTSDSLI